MDHQGLRVVITGASSGIGRATAEAFAAKGARLVLAARGQERLEEAVAACRALGATAVGVVTDVTDMAAVRSLAERAKAELGGIDLWASIVGAGVVGRYHEVPFDQHEQVIRANLLSHMGEAHAVLPIFIGQGRGTWVNMISLGGFASTPWAAAYGASKFGLKGFSEALRGELAGYPHIHVCDVYPAFVDTPGIGHAANATARRLSAPPPVIDARRVAAAIVGLARRPRATTSVGSMTRAIRLGHLLAPTLTAKSMYGFIAGYMRQAEPAPVTQGSLFTPSDGPGGIDGGLRSPRQRAMGLGAFAVLAAGIGTVALMKGRRTRNATPSPSGHVTAKP